MRDILDTRYIATLNEKYALERQLEDVPVSGMYKPGYLG